MTDSRETMRRKQFRDRAALDAVQPPARPRRRRAAPAELRELCIIEHPDGPCTRPQRPGRQLCAPCEAETDRLAADRLAAGWP